MSIYHTNLNFFTQNFDISGNNKAIYGEVHTDFKLINEMLQLIPNEFFKNPDLTWLDPCTGRGYFSMVLYKKLFFHLSKVIINPEERHNHIITKMIYMVEINNEFIPTLKKMFGEKSNIFNKNFLDFKINKKFNFIIGNPPFNVGGLIKVPTKQGIKTKDGRTIWQSFIKKSMDLLTYKGFLLFITPSIWMKSDHPLYQHMLSYKIYKIKTLTNTETNKIFHKQAQTPTCFFLLQSIVHKNLDYSTKIYDKIYKKYFKFNVKHQQIISLPLCMPSIIQKLYNIRLQYDNIKVIKTSMRPGYKNLKISYIANEEHPYPNISTCKLNKLQPQLIINYSNIKCSHYKQPKLVLAHKMYGFPFYDKEGKFGISNRDNFVILHKNDKDFIKLKQFLSTKFIISLFEATRYRMKYLERYIFDILPDVTLIDEFPEDINEESVLNFFNINEVERNFINLCLKKNYLTF